MAILILLMWLPFAVIIEAFLVRFIWNDFVAASTPDVAELTLRGAVGLVLLMAVFLMRTKSDKDDDVTMERVLKLIVGGLFLTVVMLVLALALRAVL